jgi:Spx/MgsR family transcriptional regulator
MQKAIKWLDVNKVAYKFHNYKTLSITEPSLRLWLQHFPASKLINTKSTTYKALTDEQKASIDNADKAIEIMLQNQSVIKRPVWDLGNGTYYLGWHEAELSKLIL